LDKNPSHLIEEQKVNDLKAHLTENRVGGDGTVPSESALTAYLKWSYEFHNRD